MHKTDKLALLALVVGLGSFASTLPTYVNTHNTWLTTILLGLGVAGQTANQLLRIYGAPSEPTSTTKG